MDIAQIIPQFRTIEILHPSTGEPIGLRITLRPMSDPRVQAVIRRNTNAALNSRTKLTAEQAEVNAMSLLVAATEGWEWYGDATFQGGRPECTDEHVRRVYRTAEFIRKQVDRELADEAAFFADSAKS